MDPLFNPLLLTDYYKTEHFRMYPENMSLLYSNFTPRKSRIERVDSVVFFGLQHFALNFLIKQFKTGFFDRPWKEVDEEYKFAVNVDTDHIKALHELGYLPVKVKAVPEGTLVPIGVPCLTIRSTQGKKYSWLVNYLETLISAQMWQPITSATLAYEFKKQLVADAIETGGDLSFIQWQGHDFSMRGMSSAESAILSGMGHLTSFSGTDTIPAIYALRNSYGSTGLIGASVPATEHSVMCMGTKEDEIETFRRLIKKYPTGILSIVCDTWSQPHVIAHILPQLKKEIMARDGKLVLRPDSFWTDPVDCIAGFDGWHIKMQRLSPEEVQTVRDGLVESLYKIFGGTKNEKGYIQLDPHIGAIYGDSINKDRAASIAKRLKNKGFASTNLVYGIGSYTYQYNTRDTFGFAMKATYGELENQYESNVSPTGFVTRIEPREIFKDPITDDGTKKSAKGLLRVDRIEKFVSNSYGKLVPDGYTLKLTDRVSWEEEDKGILEPVFEDGRLLRRQSLDNIRERLAA